MRIKHNPPEQLNSAEASMVKPQRLLAPDPLLQFYRVPLAASLLGIDRGTLYAKVKRGELPTFQSVGGIKGYTAECIRSIYQAD